MLRAEVRGPTAAEFNEFRRNGIQIIERAAIASVGKIAARGKSVIRSDMAGAGLGRLGNAIGASSDADTGQVKRFPGEDFKTRALFFARTRSPRTLGALEAYTQGATITPRRGRWLWIATPEAGRLIGSGRNRRRMTPDEYRKGGEKLGPLVFLRAPNGSPLLAVRNVGVSAVGARGGRARSLTKKGLPRKGDRSREIVVLFVGIPHTSRAARVDLTAIFRSLRSDLATEFDRQLAKARR